jgi:phosphate starvation-inducible PhoH-like protein
MATKTLYFSSPRHLHSLYAGSEENLALAEELLGVKLVSREDWLKVEGPARRIARAEQLFNLLNDARSQGLAIATADFHRFTEAVTTGAGGELSALYGQPMVVETPRLSVVPKTLGQKLYLQAIQRSLIVFGIGPAGTGKTWLAMAQAVAALQAGQVRRIVLTRPAVEAGESLGFLPGDLREKILPYLRPLYDALHDMLEPAEVARLSEKNLLEIAPLAYMRGRTLSHAFVILDEAQNTTPEQMMMFLTRLGEETRMVITGDVTQIDLPRARASGLLEAERILADTPGIEFHHFGAADVVRHPLVQKIIAAYELARNPPELANGAGPRRHSRPSVAANPPLPRASS